MPVRVRARGGRGAGPCEYLLALQTNATNEDVGFELRVTLRGLPVSGSPVEVVTQPGQRSRARESRATAGEGHGCR